jgi:hypothetical protein
MTRHKPGLAKWIAWAVVLLAIMWALPSPAWAHNETDIDEWVHEWVLEADMALNRELIARWVDMMDRHPWYLEPEVEAHTHTPTVGRTDSGMGSNVAQWLPLVAKHFDPEDVGTAMCIMALESGGNPDAKNPRSTAAGLFQFLRSTWDNMVPASVSGGSYASGQVYQPEANIRSAAWLQDAAGWTQWSPYKRGNCR